MKKIAIVTTHPIQYQIPLFKKLKKYKIDVDVFFASAHGVSSKIKDHEFNQKFNWDIYKSPLGGYKSYFSKKQKSSIFDFSISFKNLEHYLKKKNYDGLLILGWNKVLYLKALFLAKKLKIKTILRVETNLESKNFFLKKYLKFFILRIFFKLFDSFLYIGSLNKKFYTFYGVPKKKLYYAPYFVENNFFKKKIDKKNIIKKLNLKNKKIILFVGKLIERKNPYDFLKLAQKFKDNKKIHFLIVGSGKLQDNCQNFIDHNKLDNTTIIGFLNQKKIRDIYSISDLMILTSKYETWGLVINEAMASGVPVIATKESGATIDLIENGKTGYSYNYHNFNQLYSQFNKIIFNTKKLKTMKKNVKKKVKEFTCDQTIKSIKKIL